MRNSVPKSLLLAILGLICVTTGAFASQSFTLTGAGPAHLGGVYTSPYTATIEGVGSGIKVFCDDFIDDVYIGETWQVNATKLSDLPLSDPGSPLMWNNDNTTKQVTNYITAALLASQLLQLGNPQSLAAEEISWAIWDVFDPTAPLYSADYLPAYATDIAGYLTAAQAQANAIVGTAPTLITLRAAVSSFSNVTIYTPSPKDQTAVIGICPAGVGKCGLPQEFISVSMAEPSSPLLLGFDFLAIGGLVLAVRRRKSKVLAA